MSDFLKMYKLVIYAWFVYNKLYFFVIGFYSAFFGFFKTRPANRMTT
jgi:hypothetical protein